MNAQSPERILLELGVDDLMKAFASEKAASKAPWLRAAFELPARKFARALARLDADCAREGIAGASRNFLGDVLEPRRLDAITGARVKSDGSTLFLSNHPGLYDALALFAATGRDDLKVIAINRPFLRALPSLSRHLIPISDDEVRASASKREALREAITWLAQGHAVLTFPAGSIEPDPAYAQATRSLGEWSRSTGIMANSSGARVTLCCVSGVISPRYARHPLSFLRRLDTDRSWMRALLQLMASSFRGTAASPPLEVRFTDLPHGADHLAAIAPTMAEMYRAARISF